MKTTTVETKYTVAEIEAALRAHFKLPPEAVIQFEVEQKYDPTDWRGEYPPDHVFGGAVITKTKVEP